MGKLVHKRKDYTGVSPYEFVPITEDDYNALTPAEQEDETKMYWLYDVDTVSADIDDESVSSGKVWSSEKVSSEINSALPYFIEKSGSFSIGTSVTYYDIPLNLSAEDYQNYKFTNVSASDSAVRIYNSYVISNGSTLRVVANASQAVTVALKAVIVCQKAI